MMGIEPTSPAWKAGVIAIIRHSQNLSYLYRFYKKLSIANLIFL